MKRITLIILTILSISWVYGQQMITYTFDPTSFLIIDETTSDSILYINANNNLRTHGSFRVQKGSDKGSIRLVSQKNPELNLLDEYGNKTVRISSELNGSGGAILLSDQMNGDTNSIRLVTNYSGTNDARVITDEIQINGGSDLAEMFEISNPEAEIRKGLLVSIDPDYPGQLRISDKAYDQKIAGIVAGANGVKPGILMGQKGSPAFGDDLITLSGRTYVKANTSNGAINVGDFLTSSDISGEAMKVNRLKKARGSIIGKAMTPLKTGSDYVLVLVNLQ